MGSLIHGVGADVAAALPLGCLMLIGLMWYLLACANIWRAALDSGLGLGATISVGYFLLSIVLEQLVVPTK